MKIATRIVTCSRHVIVAALQRYLSHKDNRDFKIWHKAPTHGQNYPVQKKNTFRQQLAAFQKQYILNILLKFLTYLRLYKATQNWRNLILVAIMFTNSIDGLRIISIVTSNPGLNHQPNYHNIALCQTLFNSFVHHVLIKKDRRVNIPSV